MHLFLLASLFYSLCSLAQTKVEQTTAIELLQTMHKRYYHAPCKTYTFSQKNTHYKNDTFAGHSEWHESIEFPDKFKIEFGSKGSGDFVVFKNDSVFNYQKNKFVKSRIDSNTLLLLLGGMYYRSLEDVINRLQKAKYNLSTYSEQVWNGKSAFVIGAKQGELDLNQFWVDKNTFCVLRIIEKMQNSDMMDMRFESHQKLCNGFVENKVSFRRNGHLEQVEEYFDIHEASAFQEKLKRNE